MNNNWKIEFRSKCKVCCKKLSLDIPRSIVVIKIESGFSNRYYFFLSRGQFSNLLDNILWCFTCLMRMYARC